MSDIEVKQEDNKEESKTSKKKKTHIKYIINMVLVLVLTVGALFVSLGQNFEASFAILGNCEWQFLLIMIAIMFSVTFIRSFILFLFARLYTRDYHIHQAIAVESIGNFYSAITPGATGGQVMEAYTFKKQGVKISNAVSMLAMYSIVFQIVLTVSGIISFVVKFDVLNEISYIQLNLGFVDFKLSIWLLTIIGFILNVGVILLVFLMAYWHKFHNFILGPIVSLFVKLRIVRNPDKTRENLRIQVENFKIEFRRLLTNIPFFVLTAVLFVIFFIVRYSLPYFAGLALGNQGVGATASGFWDSFFLCNYHQMVTGLIPLPGSAGISEYFFTQLFVDSVNPENGFYYLVKDGVNVSEQLCSAAMLLWRTMSFTLPLIFAGVVTAFYHVTPKQISEQNNEVPSRQTFVDMQSETLVSRQNELGQTLATGLLTKEAIINKLKSRKPKSNKANKSSSKDNQDNDDYDSINVDIEK